MDAWTRAAAKALSAKKREPIPDISAIRGEWDEPMGAPLRMRIVDGHERSEAVRAHVTGHDQEIARWDVWKKPVLVAEGDDPHLTCWSEPASLTSLRRASG